MGLTIIYIYLTRGVLIKFHESHNGNGPLGHSLSDHIWLNSNGRTLLVQHDVTVDHTMLSGVAKPSNLRCSTVYDNVCSTMLKGYVKLTYIC